MHAEDPPGPRFQPLISVVIPTFSRPEPLGRCLATLAEQTIARERFEVIVVDDGSEEPLDNVVAHHRRSMQTTLLRQRNQGPGAARNRGAAHARGELLAFTDDDCLPDPGWLSALAREYASRPSDLLGGRVLNNDPGNVYAETGQAILDGAYRYYAAHPGSGRFFASNNMAVPARAFAELGGFDAGFRPASEDRDLCDRWLSSGRSLRFVEDAVVRHDPQLDLAGFTRQYFDYGRGAFQFHRTRSARHAEPVSNALGPHLHFLREIGRGLTQYSPAKRLRMAALLLLWQSTNVAGYLAAAMRRNRR